MPIISTRDITLYGGNDVNDIVLCPLSDEHEMSELLED